MKVFYPSTTEKIIHKGKSGNIYRLDGIQKCISLRDRLNKLNNFEIINTSIDNSNIKEVRNLINRIHTPEILDAYESGTPSSLANSSGIMWQPDLYAYALESALASKLSAEEAFQDKNSIALVGGGHHAEYSRSLGFCLVNTMAIASKVIASMNKKVAVIDLDTHYSNGCFDVLKNEKNIYVYSLWNQALSKWNFYESKGNIWHREVRDSIDYFEQLNILVDEVLNLKPDVIIYHLGLDILSFDRMGGVKGIGIKDIEKRDMMIKKLIKSLNIPICIFLGGAYIDWSKGQEYASEQRDRLTSIFSNSLNILVR